MDNITPGAYTAPIEQLLATLRDETNPERFVDLLVLMRAIKRDVDVIARDAENAAIDTFGGQREWTIGRHALEVRSSKRRRWTDNDGLRSRVGLVARFDPDTGEARTADDAVAILTKAFRCGGAEARTTWLKQHDIDPDDYSEGEWSASITITPAQIPSDATTRENTHD